MLFNFSVYIITLLLFSIQARTMLILRTLWILALVPVRTTGKSRCGSCPG